MQKQRIHVPVSHYPQLKSINNATLSTLDKVKQIETLQSDCNHILLKKFLKELQSTHEEFVALNNRKIA